MAFCPACGKQLIENAKFCDGCGAPVQPAPAQSEPAQPVPEKTPVPIQEKSAQEAPAQEAPAQPASVQETSFAPQGTPKKKFDFSALPKKLIYSVLGGVAALILLIVILASVFSGGKANFALYISDGELFFTDFDGKGWQVTEKMGDTPAAPQVSRDGKTIVYLDKGDDSNVLYIRTVGKDEDPTKLDSSVSAFFVNEDFNRITYLKDGVLYQHNLKEKEKIASDVDFFRASPDGKIIYFAQDDEDYYVKQAGKDKEKVDSEIDSLRLSEDFKTAYYLKESGLYMKKIGDDKEKIESDVQRIVSVYEGDRIYYVKVETEQTTLDTFVNDDLAASDSAMTEPVEPQMPDYPYSFDYDTYDEYLAAREQYQKDYAQYQTDRDEYYEKRQAWREKEERDSLRASLKEESVTSYTYQFAFFDGKESRNLTDPIAAAEGSFGSDYAVDEAVAVFRVIPKEQMEKVKLSENSSVSQIRNKLSESSEGEAEYWIAVGKEITALSLDHVDSYSLSEDGKTAMFMVDVNEEETKGDLYAVSISSTVGKPELYDSDVAPGHWNQYGDSVYYLKDFENDSGTLYCNKNEIDSDVYAYHMEVYEDRVLYLVDWNSEKNYGTLKLYDGKESVSVEDDVRLGRFSTCGDVLFLYDFSQEHAKGELRYFDGKESVKIADDVSYIYVPELDD